MQKLLFSFALILVSGLSSCKKAEQPATVPACIQQYIDQNKDRRDWGYKSIVEYKYQGTTVYLFNPDNNLADAQAPVLLSDCSVLCNLGGITGNTMCNGENFNNRAVLIRTVWQK